MPDPRDRDQNSTPDHLPGDGVEYDYGTPEAQEGAKKNPWFRQLLNKAQEQLHDEEPEPEPYEPFPNETPSGFDPTPPTSSEVGGSDFERDPAMDAAVADPSGGTTSGGFDPTPPTSSEPGSADFERDPAMDAAVADTSGADAARSAIDPLPPVSEVPPKTFPFVPVVLGGLVVAAAIVIPLAVLGGSSPKNNAGTASAPSAASESVVPPATAASPYLDTALYAGTVRPASTCVDPKSCTSFVISFTNTTKVTMNSFLIGTNSDAFTAFDLTGSPACTATKGEFGPDFKNAWLCLGVTIPPNGTITGSGTAMAPLTPASTVRFDWSNAGNARGLLPDYSQDIHYYPVPVAK